MSDYRVRYLVGATVLGAAVILVALLLAGSDARTAVMAGGGFGLLLQLGIFVLLGVVLFPGRRLLVFALGMVLRVVGLGILVLVTVRLGLPPAPTLLTLVGVFVVTTMLEPIVFQLETKNMG